MRYCEATSQHEKDMACRSSSSPILHNACYTICSCTSSESSWLHFLTRELVLRSEEAGLVSLSQVYRAVTDVHLQHASLSLLIASVAQCRPSCSVAV